IKNWLFCVNTIDSLFVYFVRAPDMRKVRPSPSALAIRCVGKLRGLPLCLPFAMPIFRSHRTGTLGQGYAHIPPCSPLTVTRARNDRLCVAPLGKRSYFATLSTRQYYFPRPLTSLIRTYSQASRPGYPRTFRIKNVSRRGLYRLYSALPPNNIPPRHTAISDNRYAVLMLIIRTPP